MALEQALLLNNSLLQQLSRFQVLEERLALILLTTPGQFGSPSFHMTHECLAQALAASA